MKKIMLVMLIFVMIFCSGCATEKQEVKKAAQSTVDCFEKNDIAGINKILFGEEALANDALLKAELGIEDDSDTSVLREIFEKTEIRVKKVTDDSIVYQVEAPDMSSVFTDVIADSASMTEEDLFNYIQNYAENTSVRTEKVSVPYLVENGEPIIQYRSQEFINAVTGGLLNAYIELYPLMISEYENGGM